MLFIFVIEIDGCLGRDNITCNFLLRICKEVVQVTSLSTTPDPEYVDNKYIRYELLEVVQ